MAAGISPIDDFLRFYLFMAFEMRLFGLFKVTAYKVVYKLGMPSQKKKEISPINLCFAFKQLY